MGRFMENKSALAGANGGIGQVRPWHRQMARLVAAGARPGEIAGSFGYTPGQVSRILGSPLFQAEVARMEGQTEDLAVSVREDLQLMSLRAIEVLDASLDEPVESWKERATLIDAAFGVLDRAGYGKKEQPQDHRHLHLHAAAVKEMSNEELLKNVIDVAAEEVD